MILLTTVQTVELGISVVVFALCLAGFLHQKSALKNLSDEKDSKIIKKRSKRKKLFFVGMIFGLWFLLGVVLTAFSGIKGGLKIEFEMFSERVDIFGISLAKTTIIAACVSAVLMILCVLFRVICVPKFKDEPSGLQNAMEIAVEAIDGFVEKAVGNNFAEFLSPYMFSMAAFIIGCASVELLGLRAPTSDLTTTFAMGLLTFVLLNVLGVKKLGIGGRLKSMGGPIAPMRAVMIPLKMVSDIAVPVSLACRLFGNMLGGMIVMDLLKGALGGYGSALPGIAGLYFNLFHPLIQGYIFITLSLTFIDEAMEEPEESEKKQKKSKNNKENTADIA